jgi:hypothetical protein
VKIDPATMTPLGVLGVTSFISGVVSDGTYVFVSLADGVFKLSTTGAFLAAYPSSGLEHFGALSLSSPLTKSSSADSVLWPRHGGNQRWRWGDRTRFRAI